MQTRWMILLFAFCLVVATSPHGVVWADAGPVHPDVQKHLDRLTAASEGTARISLNKATGTARLVQIREGRLALDTSSLKSNEPTELAEAFLEQFGGVFGVRNVAAELELDDVVKDRLNATHLTYRQIFKGVPVFGATLKVHLDAAGKIAVVNGAFVPDLTIGTRPVLDRTAAGIVAIARVADQLGAKAGLEVREARLLIFRTHLVQGLPGSNHLAWEVEVVRGDDVREYLYVDAHKGDVLDQITGIYHGGALDRRVYDGGFGADHLVWSEGDATPYGDEDVDHLIDYSEDSYNLFASMTGGTFLSWDGVGARMHAVNNATSIACPNANWNGVSTNYCAGVTADDTVAHEWAHAYTDSTHDLIYQWQPGALNESYSDIWGEVVDFLNGSGTDAPIERRQDGTCSTAGGSVPPTFTISAPEALAGEIAAGGANFGPETAELFDAEIELVDDQNDTDGSFTDGCQPLVGFTPGKIALIDRGRCSFASKVSRAQEAGAVGAIVANNGGDSIQRMSGTDESITIPAIFIGQSDGQAIKEQLGGKAVVASIVVTAPTDPSLRWMAGEDDPAFGGAIRDMWNPTCYIDPGKVTDAEYWCSAGDSGGVHSNSGVPNHAFALLVDGGTYNGQTIESIGLTKASHIYWRAQSVYQISISNFVDHADALELSCLDLLGQPLFELSTDVPVTELSEEFVAPVDCQAVSKAIAAVELRVEPTQCNFEPLLLSDPPSLCDGFKPPVTLSMVDWEAGVGDWIAGTRGVRNPVTFDTPNWQVVSPLPADRPGSAAFVANLVIGNCRDDDETGVLFLESPDIVLPTDQSAPKLAFDHWVATELRWDGANVKVSVNGGDYKVVPDAAFLFNSYTENLNSSAQGNTNPMAGEPAFSGSDGGSVVGSWGQSQIDLATVATPGDTIRLRFEMGLDGCNGRVGWYVDDVHLYSCSCGNGQLEIGENCDDGGFVDGDGCSADCQIESDWICEDPIEGGAGNAIADAGLEASAPNPFWDESSMASATLFCDLASCGDGGGTGPRSGKGWAWFGGVTQLTVDTIEQQVQIDVGSNELTFWLEQVLCDSVTDFLELSIDGVEVWRTDGGSELCGVPGYVQQAVDVSAFADGGVHTVEFFATTFGTNGGVTNFFVDDLFLPGTSETTASECRPLYCSTPDVAIPDNDPVGTTDLLQVAAAGDIGDLQIYLRADHTFMGDLQVSLEHVDTGTSVMLVDKPGQTICSGNDIDLFLDDDASPSVQGDCTSGANPSPAYVDGLAYMPAEPLASFDGENLAGDWALTVSDGADFDTGTLIEWCLVPACGAEICGDGIDNDCDGQVDEDTAPDAMIWYEDVDGDGYGVDFSSIISCTQPDGFVATGGDCDDFNSSVNPGGSEICGDFLDNDCDAGTPDVFDVDSDGFDCLADCDDSNADAWDTPGVLPTSLSFAADKVTLAWDPPVLPGGNVLVYDVLRANAGSDFVSSTTCVESDDGADATAVDAIAPPSDKVFFYLVRPKNDCPSGSGPLGAASDGSLRSGRDCP